jgi:DOMON domain/Eukaryotic cytochrome b561
MALLLFFLLSPLFVSVKSHSAHHNTPLSHLYNNSVLLDDRQVTFYWTLSNSSISLAAQSARKSNYLAIGFGETMKNSYAYVSWTEKHGKCHVRSYWISGRDASNVFLTSEKLTDVQCQLNNGIISFQLNRPLVPSCTGRIECDNIIDPTKPLSVIWAMGREWSGTHLTEKNMHFAMSDRPEPVFLLSGLAKEERDLAIILAVHGFFMFVSWGILLPGGILSARFLKHANGDLWFKSHQYLQYSGLGIAFIALIVASIGLGGTDFSSSHVKFGTVAVLLSVSQPINGFFRPEKTETAGTGSNKRVIWEYAHAITGRVSLLFGIIGLFTGLMHFGEAHDSEIAERLIFGLVLWILISISVLMYLEFKELRRRKRERNFSEANWELGELDDDELVDLLEADERQECTTT